MKHVTQLFIPRTLQRDEVVGFRCGGLIPIIRLGLVLLCLGLAATCPAQPSLPASFARPIGSGLAPGFTVRLVQAPASPGLADSTARAEAQLAGAYPDERHGFATPMLINYNVEAPKAVGNFGNDALFPGINPALNRNNFALEAVAYLALEAGDYRFGVNSDDGFRLTAGPVPSDTSLVLGEHNGGRGSSDTQFDFRVETNGVYAFRLTWEQGSGGANLEWFSVDRSNGARTLINDTNSTSAIRAFQYCSALANPVSFAKQPESIAVPEISTATFKAGVLSGSVTNPFSLFYQWQTNGVDIPGANRFEYTTPRLRRAEDQTRFRCLVTQPGYPTVASAEAVLTVIPDRIAPEAVSAVTLIASDTVGIRFSELLDPVAVTNVAHYQLSHGARVTQAMLRPDETSVALTVSGYSYTNFTVTINQVRDLAGNPVAANTVVPVRVLALESQDVGRPGDPVDRGLAYTSAPGEFEVVASGSDIWNNQDGGHFVYEIKEGDFEVKVQVTREDQKSSYTRAGLMARENLSAGSRHVNVTMFPPQGANRYEAHYRAQQDGGTGIWPGGGSVVGVPIPNAWVRLARQGDTFTAYRGTNGVDWEQFAQMSAVFPKRLFVGMATSAQNNGSGQSTVAWYRNYGDITPGAAVALAIPDLMIKKANETETSYTSRGIYQISPTQDQMKTQVVLPNQTAIYQVKVENTGQTNSVFVVKSAESAESYWAVVYRVGNSNVSTAILSPSGYLTANLAPGASEVISLEVSPGRRPPGGSSKVVRIRVFPDPFSANSRDAVQAVTTVESVLQPDLAVRRDFDLNYLGDDLYNHTGAGQTKRLEVEPGASAIYLLQTGNDGNIPDALQLSGPGDGNGWTVNYYTTRRALRFDGQNDFVNLGAWTPGNQWTVEAWVKPASVPGGRRTIAGGFAECRDWGITLQDGQFGVAIQPPGACNATIRSGESVVPGTWYHVAGTCDGTNAFLFVNGELKSTDRSANYTGTAAGVRIGSEVCCGGNSFPGIIDEVRVWNRALTADEIQSRRNFVLAGDEPGLLGYWRFEEASGATTRDASTNGHNGTLANGPIWDSNLDNLGGMEISSHVSGAGWTNLLLAAGATTEFLIEVIPDMTVTAGAARELALTLASLGQTNLSDTIKLVTSVTQPSSQPVSALYTTDADFDQGRLAGLEYTSVPNQLQLARESVTLPFIWVPNSNESTVSKVDTRSGHELGRYRTGPGSNGNPSRTTVDQFGNCWVANRQTATAIKMGLYENGQYLDRNQNGVIETSRDLNGDGDITGNEILPWSQDECVLYEVILIPGKEGTFTPGTYPGSYADNYWNPGPRGIAVDGQGNVWIGTHDSKKFYYLDGRTAQILRTVDVSPLDHTSYGALIDAQGILWSSGNHRNHVLRLDPTDNSISVVNVGHWVYGIGLDRNNHLFVSGITDLKLSRINVLTATKEWTINAPGRGIAVTDDGDIWTPDSAGGTVTRRSNDGLLRATIPVGVEPTGVSVDAAGKVWAVNNGDEYIKRIDPATDSIDLSKRIIGGTHYGYSDMTGIISRSATTRFGIWSVVHNAKVQNSAWDTVAWHQEAPTGTNVTVRVRSSNDRQRWSPWEEAVNGSRLAATPPGQYVELEVTLQSTLSGASPILYDLAVNALPPSQVDLEAMAIATPSPARSEHTFAYSLTVTNRSTAWASGIVLTDTLPGGVEFFSAHVPGGFYQLTNGVATFQWAGLAARASATATLTVIAQSPGMLTNRISVTANETDPNPANNLSTLVTQVQPLLCVVPPMGMVGWWPGDTDANDLIGAHHGALNNGASIAAGKVGGAFTNLNSQANYVSVPHSPGLDLSDGSYTLENWVLIRGFNSEWAPLTAVQYANFGGLWFNHNSKFLRAHLYVKGKPVYLHLDVPFTFPVGAWTHVAQVYHADTYTFSILVNGVVIGSGPGQTGPDSQAVNTHPVMIGKGWRQGDTFAHYDAVLDEVTVYNRALSTDEIQAIYDARSVGKCKDAVFINTPVDFPVGVVGRDYLQPVRAALGVPPYQFSLESGKLPAGLTLSSAGMVSGQPGEMGTFNFTLRATDSLGQSAPHPYSLHVLPCMPISDDLVGWWPGDGTPDDNVSTNHGTLGPGVSFVPGKVGKAFRFVDASDSFVGLPNSSKFMPTNNQLTIEAWIRPDYNVTGNKLDTILAKRDGCGSTISYQFGVGKGHRGWLGNIWFASSGFSPDTIVSTNTVPNDGQFHHVAVTLNGSKAAENVHLYLDGQAVLVTDARGAIPVTSAAPVMGKHAECAGYYSSAAMDEVSFYERELSAAEIEALHQAGPAGKCYTSPADLLLKTAGESDTAFALDDVYLTTPAEGQIKSQIVAPQTTATYHVKVENDSDTERAFVLWAAESSEPGWNVVYKFGTNDITSLIHSSPGYLTTNLAPGGSQIIALEMTSGSRVPGHSGKSAAVYVFLDSQAATVRDSIQAATYCQPVYQPDLMIRREIDLNYLGLNVFNTNGQGQTKGLEIEPGTSALYLLQLVNAGNRTNQYLLRGESGGMGWNVKYYAATPALQFDGANDSIDLGNWFDYQTFTLSLWLKPGTPQVTYADILDNNHRAGINWVLQQNGDEQNSYGIGLPNGFTFRLKANVWQYLALSRDTNRVNRLYLDGLLAGSSQSDQPINYDGNQFLRLAHWGGGGRNWRGTVDDLHLWNRALSAAEVQADMNRELTESNPGIVGFWRFDEGAGNVARDASTNAHHGTLINGPAWGSFLDAPNRRSEITSQITGSGWAQITLAPGATYELIVEVIPEATVAGGSMKEVLITATSMEDHLSSDTVKAVTVVTRSSATPEGGLYTSDADFEIGRLVGVEHARVPNQLQLMAESVTLPFIWVPNSNEGTVSKVDTRTGKELGRYRTSPYGDANPSRTTVDLNGNCWVGNRQRATVIKIGLFENGQYLDRNGDGIIQSSQDLNGDGDITGNELLPWGQDECVLFEVSLVPGQENTFTPGTAGVPYANDYWNPGPRGIAVDAQGNVWVGTHDSRKYYYLDGRTAQILRTVDTAQVDHTAYGAVIDAQGIVWSSGYKDPGQNNVLRLDPADNSVSVINLNFHTYGLGLDRHNHLFVSGHQESKLARINVLSGTVDWIVDGFYQSRGVAVTEDGDVWVACSGPGTVARFSNDGLLKTSIPVGSVPTGVSVDAAGKVWVVNNGDEFIKRIDPATDSIDLSKRIIGGTHYGYSDMTGILSRNTTTRIGYWSTIHNSKVANTPWGIVSWNGFEPAGTTMTVRVRSSHDQKTWSFWETAFNAKRLLSTPPGKYLEVEATLQTVTGDVSPILYDLSIQPVMEITFGQEIYQNDFQGAVGPEWSNPQTDLTPSGARRFLGQFGNQTVSLALSNLPPHVAVSVVFDLFVIRSWDGNSTNDGPDLWELNVAGGRKLFYTTFNNGPTNSAADGQAYPALFPNGLYPPRNGAAETNTLGFVGADRGALDSVYLLNSTLPHTVDTLLLNFSAAGLNSNLAEESWGLDNVRIFITPPAPLLYLAPIGLNAQGQFQLQLLGEPQKSYVIHASTNLVDWMPLSTNLLTTNRLDLLDMGTPSLNHRFYRATQQP